MTTAMLLVAALGATQDVSMGPFDLARHTSTCVPTPRRWSADFTVNELLRIVDGTITMEYRERNFDPITLDITSGYWMMPGPGYRITSNTEAGIWRIENSIFAWHPRDHNCRHHTGTQWLAGDANFDRLFNSADLVQVYQAGKYEVPWQLARATWLEGDWDGDQDFDSFDLVKAMSETGYLDLTEWPGPDQEFIDAHQPGRAVPEPSAMGLLLMALAIGAAVRRWPAIQ